MPGVNSAPDFPSFETLLANEWADIVDSEQHQQILLQSGLVPLVVEASSALLAALEKEAADVRANPAAKPRQPINPLVFIASYLMRKNPRHAPATLPPPSPYRVAAMSPTSKCQTPRTSKAPNW